MNVCAFSAGDGSVPLGMVAAALGLLRWAPFTVEGQLLGGSQDTRHILAISQVCVSFVSLKLFVPWVVLCWLASRCSGFFSRRIPGAVCFSLFHCKAMTLLAVPHSLLECAHFPSPEVHFACRCVAQVFF